MPIGTPVLATRDGVVAAAVGNFKGGGTRVEHKARANYVAIRHNDGLYSRYYHLQHLSVIVRAGQAVMDGQVRAQCPVVEAYTGCFIRARDGGRAVVAR